MKKEVYLKIRKENPFPVQKYKIWAHLCGDAALWIAAFALTRLQNGMSYFAIPLFSILMFRNFSLMHEAVHGLVSKNKNLNDWIGMWAGGVCFLPFAAWKKAHLEHHHWTGNVEKDPVMALIDIIPRMPPRLKNSLSFFWQKWIPSLALLQNIVFWTICLKKSFQKGSPGSLKISLLIPIALWSTLLAVTPAGFVAGIFLPAVALYLLGVEIVNFPHHLELPQFRGDTKLPLWLQYVACRSCIYPRWVAQWIILNFNYHTEHHLFPDAPWYHLEKLHVILKEALQDSYNSDPQFSWILKNRPLSLEKVVAAQPANEQDLKVIAA